MVQQTGLKPTSMRPVARFALSDAPRAAPSDAGPTRAQRVPLGSAVVQREGDDSILSALSPAALLNHAIDLMPGPVAKLVRDIRAQGIIGYLGAMVRRGLSVLFGGLADMSPALGEAITVIGAIAGRVSQIIGALAGGDCGPLFAAITALKTAISDAAGAAWDRVTTFLAPVGEFFKNIWNRFGAPAIDWLSQVAGDVWNEITSIARDIWGATAPLRSTLGAAFGAAWSAIKNFIGVGGDEGDSGGGLIGWVTKQANQAWGGIKQLAAPVIEPIQRVVAKVADVLPLSAIVNLRATVDKWLDEVGNSADALGEPDTMASEGGQGSLRDTLLPALNNAIAGVQGGAQAAGAWVSLQIGGLASTLTGMLDSIARNPVLGVLSGAIAWLHGGVDRMAGWATASVGAAFAMVNQGLASLGSFARRGLDFLLQLGATVGDLAGRLGDLVLGRLWRMIPACIRDPVVDFLVKQVLRRIPVFSQLMDVPDLWKRVSTLALTLIRKVFIDGNLAGAAWTFFRNVLDVIGLPAQLVTGVVSKAAHALKDILHAPVDFLSNLLGALKQGFVGFFGNIAKYLLNGLATWLFDEVGEAGIKVTIPTEFSLRAVLGFVFEVLGVTVDHIFERIREKLGEPAAKHLRQAWNVAPGRSPGLAR